MILDGIRNLCADFYVLTPFQAPLENKLTVLALKTKENV